MPKPSLRTRSEKKRFLLLPGGRTEIHRKCEKIGVSHCTRCGRTLSAVPRLIPSSLRKLSATQRRLDRMYGNQLCHSCLQDLLKHEARNL